MTTLLESTPRLSERLQSARDALPRTLSIVGEDKSASWQWRVAWPSKALSDRGFVADWCLAYMAGGLVPLLADGRYNLVIMSRLNWATPELASEWRSLLHNNGLLWVYSADDDVWGPDLTARLEHLSEDQRERGHAQLEHDRLERIAEVNRADAVLVSTEYLATVARKLTDKPVVCVPNLIDANWFKGRLEDAKRTVPPLTVGWSGTFRPDSDLSNVAEAWSRLAKRYPDVTFVTHGTRIPVLLDAVPGLRVLPWSSLSDYPRVLLNVDIMCCSVAGDDDFSASKSPIKWAEATLAGATCVVSDALYGRTVRDGDDGLIASSTDEWEHAISRLIENEQLRREIQGRAEHRVLSQFSLAAQWPQWIENMSTLLGGTNGWR